MTYTKCIAIIVVSLLSRGALRENETLGENICTVDYCSEQLADYGQSLDSPNRTFYDLLNTP